MSYDVSKLTNLGQMKSALQTVKTQIDAVKSSRTTVTVAVADWSAYDTIFRSTSIITPSNYHYYDIHLSSDTSATTSIMCANADIRAKIESNSIYLYCYGTKPTQSFNLEIIDTPISQNVIGLTYDIGDDFLVYPARVDAIEAKLNKTNSTIAEEWRSTSSYTTGNEVLYNGDLYVAQTTVPSGSWDSSKWVKYSVSDQLKSIINNIANYFSTSTYYYRGDWVWYDNRFYECIVDSAHGTFNSSEWASGSLVSNTKLIEYYLGNPNQNASPDGDVAWKRIKNAELDIDRLEEDTPKLILAASNVEVPTSKWTTGGSGGYTYKAVLNMTDVTADYFPMVQFADADAATYDFSPTVTPGSGTITIYCKTAPSSAITITSIVCLKCTTRTVT